MSDPDEYPPCMTLEEVYDRLIVWHYPRHAFQKRDLQRVAWDSQNTDDIDLHLGRLWTDMHYMSDY